jgi:aryl-alcohol dehydrogenase-like predicted oxidoreductase
VRQEFTHTTLGGLGARVCRIGLSASYRPGEAAIRRAMDAGVNLFFAYSIDRQMTKVLRAIPPGERERQVFVTGGYNLGFNRRPNLRRVLEKCLRRLRIDYLDVFLFMGVLKPAHLSDFTLEQMQRLKEEGRIRAIGISCHDQEFLEVLARGGDLDVLMLRYNAAHRGAESRVFPALGEHGPGVISYTATRWGRLLRRPRSWPRDAPIPSARQCYRFALTDPHVDVALTAPSNAQQLDENLGALQDGPLDAEELAFMRRFGEAVRAEKKWFM